MRVTVTTEVIVGVANALIMGVRMRHFSGGRGKVYRYSRRVYSRM